MLRERCTGPVSSFYWWRSWSPGKWSGIPTPAGCCIQGALGEVPGPGKPLADFYKGDQPLKLNLDWDERVPFSDIFISTALINLSSCACLLRVSLNAHYMTRRAYFSSFLDTEDVLFRPHLVFRVSGACWSWLNLRKKTRSQTNRRR